MAGTQVDDSYERRTGLNGSAPEGEVVRDDDAALFRRSSEDLRVCAADHLFFGNTHNVAAPRAKACDDLWCDVLVGEQRKREGVHAVMLSSHVCSPLIACAAY